MLQLSPVASCLYQAPSREARWLVDKAGWLTSPANGQPRTLGALGLRLLIAPMTQLTFVSFDLQAFLFLVFHKSFAARFGHGVFMITLNVFLMAALRPFHGALAFTALLLAWYGAVAFATGLRGWFALTAPIVLALYVASGPLAEACRTQWHVSPLWGVLGTFLAPEAAVTLPLAPAHPARRAQREGRRGVAFPALLAVPAARPAGLASPPAAQGAVP